MHNLYAIFANFLDVCKMFSADLVNEKDNIPRRGVIPKFSDLEVISLSLASESIGIDIESFLFSKLNEYKDDFLLSYSVVNIMAPGSLLSVYVIKCMKELH